MENESLPLILFICTGNQIRSPLASALFARKLNVSGLQDGFRVESAGTWTPPGQSNALARVVARQMGLDLEVHRSRLVDEALLTKARLVIVMERGQKEALQVEFPKVCGKVQLLSSLAGDPAYDVPDPAGQELEAYLQVGQELQTLLERSFERICQLARTT